MISIQECYNAILQIQPELNSEKVSLFQCINRVLANNIVADIDQPPFNKSAMDGYACRYDDLHLDLIVVGEAGAGMQIDRELKIGECVRIFTGAPIPSGANCVVMQEDTIRLPSEAIKITNPKTKKNICYQGEDSKKGDVVLQKGAFLKPQHISVLAAYGVVDVPVFKPLTVSVFCSGNELVEPNILPSAALIRNSNAYQLMAQLATMNVKSDYKGILPDNYNVIAAKIKQELNLSDVIIITGGASVGDFDFMPKVLQQLEAKIVFDALNIQPGKPVIFGQIGTKFVLCLSGNPVSSFLQYKLIGEPLLKILSGNTNPLPHTHFVTLTQPIERKKGNRQLYVPVNITDNEIKPLFFNGSGHINALTLANAFVILPPGVTCINVGDTAEILPF